VAGHYVTIPVEAFNSFDLPAVCLITGVREQIGWRKRLYRWTPPWVLLLIVCFPVGAFVTVWLHRAVRVEVPISDAAWRKWKLSDSAAALSAVGVVGGLSLAAFTGSAGHSTLAWVLFVGALLLPFAAFLLVRPWQGPRIRRIEGGMVELILRNEEAADVLRAHFADVLREAP